MGRFLTWFISVFAWRAGIVLSKAFWSLGFALLVPPSAWYLVVERLMQVTGFAP